MTQTMFEQAAALFANMVYGIAFCNTHNHFDSEDIAQEVFIKLWQYGDHKNFKTLDHIKHWLIRVTVNCCNDHWRKIARVPTVYLDDISGKIMVYENVDDRLVIEELEDKGLQILLLYCYEGLSYPEIARILKISEVAARKRVSRARKAIMSTLIS